MTRDVIMVEAERKPPPSWLAWVGPLVAVLGMVGTVLAVTFGAFQARGQEAAKVEELTKRVAVVEERKADAATVADQNAAILAALTEIKATQKEQGAEQKKLTRAVDRLCDKANLSCQ